MENEQKGSAAIVGIIAILVGAAIGYGIATLTSQSAAENSSTEQKETAMTEDKAAAVPIIDTKAANLRVLINSLERQHVNLASAAVRSSFDGKADFKAVADSLDFNSVALSNAVGSVYGADAGAKFLTIWRSHIGFFVDYTVAAKKGDKAGMDAAVANLGGYADAIADLLSGANPNLPRAAVKSLVLEHVGLLKGAVDAYGAGDYAKSYAQQSAADAQIGTIADALSGAIVKQYPEKF